MLDTVNMKRDLQTPHSLFGNSQPLEYAINVYFKATIYYDSSSNNLSLDGYLFV